MPRPPDNTLPVCVLIPAYNAAEFLERCLRSVWAQTPRLPAEVIVVDDGSSDETAAIAESLGAKVVRHKTNRGLPAARNSGLAATALDWVALLDADDEWLPNHLAELWALKSDQFSFVATAALRCDPTSDHDRFQGIPRSRPAVMKSAQALVQTSNWFCVSATMVRRDAALEVGGFRPILCEDLDLWVRLLEGGAAACTPKVTVRYHVHSGQMSLDLNRMESALRGVVESHIERTGAPQRLLIRREGVVAWDALRLAIRKRQGGHAVEAARRLLSLQRSYGLACVLVLRWLSRRQAARVDRAGNPSVVMIIGDGDARDATISRLAGRSVRDLTAASPMSRVVEVVRRPAGVVVSDSLLWRSASRLLRQRAQVPSD
jgi:GT2 family glycosyltransferase